MANGVTTEWEDAHVKLGNYEAREKEVSQAELTKQEIEKAETLDPLANKNLEELKELEDDFEDDFMKQYTEKRKKEMEAQSKRLQFGYVNEISKEDYVREVTEASKEVTVLLHLYQDYNEPSVKINQLLTTLSQKYPTIKFLKSRATKCVENFPDSKVPTFIIYKNGAITNANTNNVDKQLKVLSTENLEYFLKKIGTIPLEEGEELDELEAKYSKFILKKSTKDKDEDRSDSDDDDRGYISTGFKRV
jgi:hypothetical protein